MENFKRAADIISAAVIFIGVLGIVIFQIEKLKTDTAYYISFRYLNEISEKGYMTKEAYDTFCKEIGAAGAESINFKIISRRYNNDVVCDGKRILEIVENKGELNMGQGDCIKVYVKMRYNELSFVCTVLVRSSGWEKGEVN